MAATYGRPLFEIPPLNLGRLLDDYGKLWSDGATLNDIQIDHLEDRIRRQAQMRR